MNGRTALTTAQPTPLTTQRTIGIDRHPEAVYLAGLVYSSRRTMREALSTLAVMLTNGQADALSLDWSALGFQDMAAIRSRLTERYSAVSSNKMLSGLRGVLKAARCLDQ